MVFTRVSVAWAAAGSADAARTKASINPESSRLIGPPSSFDVLQYFPGKRMQRGGERFLPTYTLPGHAAAANLKARKLGPSPVIKWYQGAALV